MNKRHSQVTIFLDRSAICLSAVVVATSLRSKRPSMTPARKKEGSRYSEGAMEPLSLRLCQRKRNLFEPLPRDWIEYGWLSCEFVRVKGRHHIFLALALPLLESLESFS